MPMMLHSLQEVVFDYIKDKTNELKLRVENKVNIADDLRDVAGYAFAMHQDLTHKDGWNIEFSETMLQNRGVPTSDPEFFRNVPALEDFCEAVRAKLQAPEADDNDR